MRLSDLSFDWFIGQLSPAHPGFWLLLSFGLSGLALLAARFLSAEAAGWVRMGRWVLIPYLGLLVGGLSPRLLGLIGFDWAAGIGLGVGLIFAIWLLLALVRVSLPQEESPARADALPARPLLEQIISTGAQEFHWAFLRGAVWEMLVSLPTPPTLPGYWAIWLASALALPGIFVQYRHASQRVITGVLLVITAIVFFYTRNFFLCWLLHASAGWLIRQETGDDRYRRPTGVNASN